MKVAVVGTGYVGLVSGTCLAEMGNTITCVDIDQKKISQLQDGIIPIYEPGLEELVKNNVATHRLSFTTDVKAAIQQNDIIIIAVGTPPNEDGSADLKHVLKVAETIGQTMIENKIIVNKSTVPVGTADRVKATIAKELKTRNLNISFSVVSNPEFLKEGAAISDFMKPDRIVVGCDNEEAQKKIAQMYHPFVLNGHRVIFMDIRSAELTKYAANAMLATKISFMNEISQIAEKVGADITAVRQGIGSDARIGFHFIYPGIGYGGSCFPKDVKALVRTGRENKIPLQILEAVEAVNLSQRQFFVNKILKKFNNDIKGKRFAVWGLSFKPETDDIREAPAIDVIEALVGAGAQIVAYDPIAGENMVEYFKHNNAALLTHFKVVADQYDALPDADALLLITEWKPFRSPDFVQIKKSLKTPLIFDGRNQYEPSEMQSLGIQYICIGRAEV